MIAEEQKNSERRSRLFKEEESKCSWLNEVSSKVMSSVLRIAVVLYQELEMIESVNIEKAL